jgi:WD40 repeat protein
MRFGGGFPIIFLGATLAIVQPLVAAALKSDEIYPIAQQITVKIDGANTGSGVIIERQGNNYTVVTNRHVVFAAGSYTVQTSDGKSYQANQIKKFSNADLAVFQFTSSQNYRVAEKGNSDQVTGGKTIYIGGYPAGISGISGRNFTFLPGQISGILSNPKDGYGFGYTVQAFQGMSGGPILDEEGKLVGIHGRAGTDVGGGGTAVLGIPLKTYLSLAGNVAATKPVVTTSTPKPQNTPTTKPVVTTSIPKPQNTPISTTSPSGNVSNSSGKFVLAKTLTGHSTKVDEYGNIKGSVSSVAFSPDGKTVASGSLDDTIKMWNVATGQEINTLKGYSYPVISVAFSPDGKTLASGGWDDTIKIWHVATGQEINTLKGHSSSDNSVAFSPDGKTLASGGLRDKTIKIWNVATGQEIRTLKGHSDMVWSVAFSPDGKTVASGSSDKTIKIWNVATGQQITTLKGDSNQVYSVAFTPDGKTLASGGWDGTIKIWNVATWQEITTLKGDSNGVVSVAFSPDGRTLASGNRDNTIKIWNVATGEEITTLKGHSKTVSSVAFSPDGKTLASGSRDATIKIWRLSE